MPAPTRKTAPLPTLLTQQCPHCRVNPVHLQQLRSEPLQASSKTGNARYWLPTACPACGGLVGLEFTKKDMSDTGLRSVTPVLAKGRYDVMHLPDSVAVHWKEACEVSELKSARRSAVVACGRALEASAQELGLPNATLYQSIENMLEQGLVTQQFRDVMDYIRLIRNTGAHASSDVSKDSADGTMLFTLQTLRLLFEVPGELERLTAHPREVTDADEGVNPAPT